MLPNSYSRMLIESYRRSLRRDATLIIIGAALTHFYSILLLQAQQPTQTLVNKVFVPSLKRREQEYLPPTSPSTADSRGGEPVFPRDLEIDLNANNSEAVASGASAVVLNVRAAPPTALVACSASRPWSSFRLRGSLLHLIEHPAALEETINQSATCSRHEQCCDESEGSCPRTLGMSPSQFLVVLRADCAQIYFKVPDCAPSTARMASKIARW
ncbi:hypothetical protein R3P38DRAFT_3211057 [Favolaschia claudopus]|uniref:Uncharacterized protein n=1 Tax=Favolaschia claudopus TaxID=2862362 RepID=A0AAW0AFY5_9AGAR